MRTSRLYPQVYPQAYDTHGSVGGMWGMETTTDSPLFEQVRDTVDEAHLIAFDGCHKIYLAMDEVEAAWFRENYEIVVQGTPDEMLETVGRWWDESCSLRFVSAVYHNEENPNAGFVRLIEQFADEEEYSYEGDDEDEDDDE